MTLTLIQSVADMAFAAYGVSGIRDTAEGLTADLGVYLNGGTAPDGGPFEGFFPAGNAAGACQLLGGDWEVAWGPCVILPPGVTGRDAAANALYVARSPSQRVYVVAIAGTNVASDYDWGWEDLDVLPPLVAWPLSATDPWRNRLPAGSNAAGISPATCTGITNLKGITDKTATDLYAYLTTTVPVDSQKTSTLIFTGHSLGGALAPTLAFDYKLSGAGGWATIQVVALAGPTAGNAAFAEAFDTAFPRIASGDPDRPCMNANYRNVLDMVPRAWNDLASLTPRRLGESLFFDTLWGTVTEALCLQIGAAILDAVLISDGGDYAPINTWTVSPGLGYFAGSTWTPLDPPSIANAVATVAELEPWLQYAHHDAYLRCFGLLPLARLPIPASQQPFCDELLAARRRMAARAVLLSGSASRSQRGIPDRMRTPD